MKDDKTSFQRQNIQGMIIISAYPLLNGLLSRSLVECKTKTVCVTVFEKEGQRIKIIISRGTHLIVISFAT